jgi:hypothetical protein
MPDPKQYPRPFVCGNPSCEKLLGIIDRDSKRIVSLYVLKETHPRGTQIEELELTRADFSVMRMGYGDIPCPCGHDTTWHWNNQLLTRVTRQPYKDLTNDV